VIAAGAGGGWGEAEEQAGMSTNLFDLTGRIALVSGASRGIGEEIARLLWQQGAHVIVSSRRIDDCTTVAESLRDAGRSAEPFACNVGEMDDIGELFAHIRESCGELDICINNAATNPFFGHVLDTDPGAFTNTVEVNVRGYFFMSSESLWEVMRSRARCPGAGR
jgi:NAD(P)-dependent dehydrogenase (short-subunit alcohol dehydrogenase family)